MFHPQADPKVTMRSASITEPASQRRLILRYLPSAGRAVDTVKPHLRLVNVAA